MQKEEVDTQSSNHEEIKKNEGVGKHPLDIDMIREIIRIIADSSYEGRYTIESLTGSLYRFGFGTSESGDISMFEGKTVNEAMYRAIDFELASLLKLTSRDELTKLAEDQDQLATTQDEQLKHKDLEEDLAVKDEEYKESMKERDELKQERKAISNIINRVTDRWKDDAVMQSFEKEIAAWKKRPSVFIAFILENIENLMHETIPYVAPSIEKIEREEHLLEEGVLALVNRIRILKPIWNDLQNKLLDGEWHAFSEVDDIIRTHGYSKLTLESMQRKRGAYIRFAKDEKYHLDRGEIDYLYKRKPVKGVYKFRFTPVEKKVKSKKPIEKAVEKGLELGRVIDVISSHPIYENPRDEFIRLFCDGKWHYSSEADEMLKKYDKYNRHKQSGVPALRSAYTRHVGKSYNKITKHEGPKYMFKFEKKRGGAKAIKSSNNVE